MSVLDERPLLAYRRRADCEQTRKRRSTTSLLLCWRQAVGRLASRDEHLQESKQVTERSGWRLKRPRRWRYRAKAAELTPPWRLRESAFRGLTGRWQTPYSHKDGTRPDACLPKDASATPYDRWHLLTAANIYCEAAELCFGRA